MIWDSTFLKTVIDLLVIAAAMFTLSVFYRYYRSIGQLRLTVGVGPLLLAMCVTALFHLSDLLIMHGVIADVSALRDLHLNLNWVRALVSMGALMLGISYLLYSLVPRTARALDALREKNKSLEGIISERLAELTAANEKLQYQAILLKHVVDAVISADKDLRVASWNQGAEKIYGWKAEEVIGRDAATLFQTVYPDGPAPPAQLHARFQESGQWVGEAIHTGKDGRKIDVFISSSPLLDESGQMIGAVAINRDITEYKKTSAALEQERNLMRLLLDNLLDFVYIKDLQSRFILANNAVAKYMGASDPQEVIGKDDREFHPPEEAETFLKDERQVIQTGEPIVNKYETNTDRQTGQLMQVLTTKLPYRDASGQIIGTIGISRDVTALTEAEQLRHDNELLETALEKERELSALKVDFMATVAHEFRTPLTIILTSSAMLNQYWERLSEDVRRKKLDSIEAQVDHLEKMLDQLSLNIRAERGYLNFDPIWVNVVELSERVAAQVQPLLGEQHSLKVVHQGDIDTVFLDGELIYHVLINLVSNAIKYSPEGGQISIALSITAGQITVRVQDQGIGIPAGDQERLFDPFFRGSNIGTIRGTGSGLSIVKEIVNLHSGSIQIESQPDQGATFIITLPTAQNGDQ